MDTTGISGVIAAHSKAIAAVAGELIVYLQLYGATWHLVPAAVMLGAALGVYGVPNQSPITTKTGA